MSRPAACEPEHRPARWALVAALGLAVAGLGTASAAPQTVTGTRGTALYHGVVNFSRLAEREKMLGEAARPTNQVVVPLLRPADAPGGPGGGGGGAPAQALAPAAQAAAPEAVSPEAAAAPAAPLSPPPAVSFLALLDDITYIPPDTGGSVGLDHLMTTLNSQVRIQDKTGGVISTVSLFNFWSILGIQSAFDPHSVYDSVANRWIFCAVSDGFAASSSILIGVSQNSDPTGNWFLYKVDADSSNAYWADYPTLGFNKDWIVVSVNMFPLSAPTYGGASLFVFNKADLYANGPGAYTLLQDFNTPGFTMVPAVDYDATADVLYLVEDTFDFTGRLRLSTISGAVGAEVLTLGTAFVVGPGGTWGIQEPIPSGSAPQLGSSARINVNDARIINAVLRNGSLWATHNVFLPVTGTRYSAVQWWQITPAGGVQQFGRIEDPAGVIWYGFPSIGVNRNNDVLIGYSTFSAQQYASGNYSFRYASDPPGTLQSDFLLKAGEAPYFKTYGGGRNRWGDYSVSVVDPANDLDLWTIQEYAATPASGWDRWGTWWGKITVGGVGPSVIQFAAPTFTVAEDTPGFATITVNNMGGSPASVDYATSDGTALAGIDYFPASGTLTFAPGQTSTNFSIVILDNALVDGDRTINLSLFNAVGANLGSASNAVLTITDDETEPIVVTGGEFNFSDTIYFVTEYETEPMPRDLNLAVVLAPDHNAYGALITVVRTNANAGRRGQGYRRSAATARETWVTGRVLVDYATTDNGSAIPYVDYIPVSGTLLFDDYQMSTNFLIYVFSDIISNGTAFVSLQLSNARPDTLEEFHRPGLIRPTIGMGSQASLVILECSYGFNVERAWYRTDEDTSSLTVGSGSGQATSFGRIVLGGADLPAGEGRRIYVDVILPTGQGGCVQAWLFSGGEYGYLAAAGSDYAEGAPFVGALPIITDPAVTYPPFQDYVPYTTNLTFGQGEFRKRFVVTITNDPLVEFNEDFIVHLRRCTPNDPPLGPNPFANVTILFDEQPTGALDREWNLDNSPRTTPPYNQTPGANGVVSALAVQPDGKALLGGDFTAVNAIPRNRLARMNQDGSVDRDFTVGAGVEGSFFPEEPHVSAIALYPSNSFLAGRFLIAGGFLSYNGVQRYGIARVFDNGALDPTFNPGNGVNGPIRSMALQPDGRILIAGDFTEYNDVSRPGFARLAPDGSLDPSFDVGAGADGTVWAIGFDSSNRVVVGGDFVFVNGVFRGGIARLDINGAVDLTFDPGTSANGPVYAVAVQTNDLVLIGGAFTEFDLRPRAGIARLNLDGSIDLSYHPGGGCDNTVFTIALQPDNKAFIGGLFTSFNGTRRLGLARLKPNGNLDTAFLDTGYNQFAGLINTYSFEPPNYVRAIAPYTGVNPADGRVTDFVMIGGYFTQVGGNHSFSMRARNPWTVYTRADKRTRWNIARLIGGVTPGPGNAEFNEERYYVDENGGAASVRLRRVDGRLGTLVAVTETSNRTAQAGLDFTGGLFTNTWPQGAYIAPESVGFVGFIYNQIPVTNNNILEGDRELDLSFFRPDGSIVLGGETIPLGGALGVDTAPLTIVDDDVNRGVFNFRFAQYFTNEGAGYAIISVIRTNGSVGVASVDYFTRTSPNPPIATAGSDYATTRSTLIFASGQTNRFFTVSLVSDTDVEFDENVELVLTNATGGATLPGGQPTSIATATLTIVDDDFTAGRLNLGAATYTTNEAAGAVTISVTRTGGDSGAVSVNYTTANGTATSPSDYLATSGTLNWNHGETVPKSFTVPLYTDALVEGTESFQVRLFNPRWQGVAEPGLLGQRTNAPVFIEDADAYGVLSFSQPFYQIEESGGRATITVLRRKGLSGAVSVTYATSPGPWTVPGVHYEETTGQLDFGPGESSKTFDIIIRDDDPPRGDGNRTVNVTLSQPVNALLGAPTNVVLTIIDSESFNEPAGSLDTAFDAGTETDAPVYALALQVTNGVTDGRILMAGEFTRVNHVVRNRIARLLTNGTLDATFAPGLGANATVRALAVQPDSKILLGGFFDQVHATNRSRIARLTADGVLDLTFDPGSGADNPVYALALQPDGKVLAGGAFSRFAGFTRPGIVRLNTNGTVDLTFLPGAGANATVYAVAVQPDGRILVGGEFTEFNGVPRRRLARLNPNGSVDATFDIGLGFDAAVRAILVQSDQRIVVGGSFTSANGTPRNYLARLLLNGALDAAFLDGELGGDNAVYALAQQVDGRLLVAGDFNRFNGVTRNRLTRLNADGTTDPTINFGNGANSFIAAMTVQPDRKIVIGGGFTMYDDQPRQHIARIHGGAMAGAGGLEFSQPLFTVSEAGTNALIVVRRRGGTVGTVGARFATTDGTAVGCATCPFCTGAHYCLTNGTVTFPPGETRQGFAVGIIDDAVTNVDRTVFLTLDNYSGGATSGPQPSATLLIVNDEVGVGFSSAYYSVSENVLSGNATLTVQRSFGTNSTLVVAYATTLNGTATPFFDYLPGSGLLTFLPGEVSKNLNVRIINDTNIEGNETVELVLANAVVTPTAPVFYGITTATLTIVEDDFGPGRLEFTDFYYTVTEDVTNAVIGITRTNGSTGIVSVRYRTADGTATAGADYVPTNNIMSFADGEIFKTFAIAIVDDNLMEGPETVTLLLSNPTGGATLGARTNATLTILDNDTNIIVAAGALLVSESGPVNNIIDPGELVTLSLGLRNIGSSGTSNLVATLLPISGVTAPNPATQSYGVVEAGGLPVFRDFTFTANGSNGYRLVVTLQLNDGGLDLGRVIFPFTIGGRATGAFANTNAILINDRSPATPYPSLLNIADLGGLITSMTVTLRGLGHTYPDDIDILLVSPSGEKVTLMSDCGSSPSANNSIDNVTITLDDTAPAPLPDSAQILSGAYRPANYEAQPGAGDSFPAPAPAPPYTNVLLAANNGANPNGVWSLFVVDDALYDSGVIARGWSLTIDTADPILSPVNLGLTAAASPGQAMLGSEITCQVVVDNKGNSAAKDVIVSDRLPAGLRFVSASASTGTWSNGPGRVVWSVGALPKNGSATMTLRTVGTAVGTHTNQFSVAASQADTSPADNVAQAVTTVFAPVPVALSVVRRGASLELSWPDAGGFVVETSDRVSGGNWTPVPGTQVVSNGRVTFTVSPAGQSRFYRLRAQ